MSLPESPRNHIKQCVQQPVKNEQQFHLLYKVNSFMTNEPFLLFFQAAYPDKEKKRKSGVVSENSSPGVQNKRAHAGNNITPQQLVPRGTCGNCETFFKNRPRKNMFGGQVKLSTRPFAYEITTFEIYREYLTGYVHPILCFQRSRYP